MPNIRCNKCGYVGEEETFRHGLDFFQNRYISDCPKCDNGQSPGGASMRMFGGQRPFEFVDSAPTPSDPLGKVLKQSEEAS